jgi:hypothetical protein
VGEILAGLGLVLHPDKTRIVDLREGREGFGWWRPETAGKVKTA